MVSVDTRADSSLQFTAFKSVSSFQLGWSLVSSWRTLIDSLVSISVSDSLIHHHL